MTAIAHEPQTYAYPPGLVEWLDEHDVRYEVIDGMLVVSPPQGTSKHARGITGLVVQLAAAAPPGIDALTALDVYYDDAGSHVGPDACVVRPEDLDDRGAVRPPLLVVEVLSPSTRRKDRLLKREIYAEFGVPSYWLVEQTTGEVTVLSLRDGAYVETARGTRLELADPFPVVVDLT